MIKKIFIFLVLTILFSSLISAVTLNQIKSLTLLSVSEAQNETYIGHTAKLYLQIRPGGGAIFIESYPLSKMDTQLSAKIANDVACSLTNIDCSKYDFFYTIRADSPIVGGPSGGSAITLLTLAMLEGIPVSEEIAMTGMISSGGVILPVDGIKEKITAAQEANLKIVFIPELALTNAFELKENQTTLTYEDLTNFSISIKPITNIAQALDVISNKESYSQDTFQVTKEYTLTMKETRDKLCQRTNELFLSLEEYSNETSFIDAQKQLNLSEETNLEQKYYASASFCYSANIKLRELQLINISQEILFQNYLSLQDSLKELNQKVDRYKLKTYTDLEAYMIVKERLIESKDYIDDLNLTNISSSNLAYALERHHSAVAWSVFLGVEGKPLQIDQENLMSACIMELQEAEMIQSYLEVFLPSEYLTQITTSTKHARTFMGEENYALCLYMATKAKANGNYVLTSLGIFEDNSTTKIIDAKTDAIKRMISKQNIFPIMGYSYLEYSSELRTEDSASSLLFSEYGLAFSDLTMYFPKETQYTLKNIPEALKYLFFFIVGMLFTIILLKFSQKRVPKRAN